MRIGIGRGSFSRTHPGCHVRHLLATFEGIPPYSISIIFIFFYLHEKCNIVEVVSVLMSKCALCFMDIFVVIKFESKFVTVRDECETEAHSNNSR